MLKNPQDLRLNGLFSPFGHFSVEFSAIRTRDAGGVNEILEDEWEAVVRREGPQADFR